MLNPSSPTNAATTGDNIRDNVEQVHIENVTTGSYTVVVTHKGTLSNGVQNVSIIISGNIATNVDLEFIDISTQTSGWQRVEWVSVVGSIDAITTKTNLLSTNSWTATSDDMSITKQDTSWTDNVNTGSSERVRFYRVERSK